MDGIKKGNLKEQPHKEEILKQWLERKEKEEKHKKEQILIENHLCDTIGNPLDLTKEEYEKVKPYLVVSNYYKTVSTSVIAVIIYLMAGLFYVVGLINMINYFDYPRSENMVFFISGIISGTFFFALGKIVRCLHNIDNKL